jgi:hypothetical protein
MAEGDPDAARAMAHESCNAPEASPSMLTIAKERKICS